MNTAKFSEVERLVSGGLLEKRMVDVTVGEFLPLLVEAIDNNTSMKKKLNSESKRIWSRSEAMKVIGTASSSFMSQLLSRYKVKAIAAKQYLQKELIKIPAFANNVDEYLLTRESNKVA